jgi:(p)ppGpp synthase/HD superfamily hydrolase
MVMSVSMIANPLELTQNLLDFIQERFLPRFPEQELGLIKRSCAFAEKHYAHVKHPTNKPYAEYVLYVAKFLIELGADAVLVSAAVICLSPSISIQVVEDFKNVFKNEPELSGLVTELMRFSHFEWNTWLSYSDDNQPAIRRDALKKMYLLALGETSSDKGPGDLLSINHFQKKEKQAENIIRMLLAATDIRVLIIKLVDRPCFMRFLKDLTPSEKDAIHVTLLARITLAVYAPLAERLGLWQLKSELEDMSFRLLDYNKYKNIADKLNAKKQQRDENIVHIIEMINALLNQCGGVDAEVIGRAKHIYSIHKKMEAKQLALEQINDLLAIRIIVNNHEEELDKQEAKDTQEAKEKQKAKEKQEAKEKQDAKDIREAKAIQDCKVIQEIIHDRWPPEISFYGGEVGKNWIDDPKENGYQSLHTTVLIEDKIVEVQIRTSRMNNVAEYGSAAAHWRYKEDRAYRRGRIPGPPGTKDRIWYEKLAQVRKNQVRKNLEDGVENNSRQFPSFERSLSQDWVYAITPNGHVVDLATGATPLDFAYRIHTDLGHMYNGAKVNGLPVRMNHMLKNGDIVEIITSHTRKGPSPNWLSRHRIDEEQKDPDFGVMLSFDLTKFPPPQWLYVSEDVSSTMNKRKKSNKNNAGQGEKYYMYYVFARTRQARTKIQNWLNKQKTDEQVKRSLKFEWYPWVSWDDMKQYAGGKRPLVPIPKEAGVYEVRHVDRKPDECLLIGRADNLENRIREELVKGDKTSHPNRQQLLAEASGDTSKLAVRWATTDFNLELENLLLNKYKKRFRGLPKYIDKA